MDQKVLQYNTQYLSKNLAPCGTDGRLLLSGFQLLVTLTLTLTLDQVIRHTVVHHSSTSIYTYQISLKSEKKFLWTDYSRDLTTFKVT